MSHRAPQRLDTPDDRTQNTRRMQHGWIGRFSRATRRGRALLATLVGLTVIGGALPMLGWTRDGSWNVWAAWRTEPLTAIAAGDTTVIWGPRSFTTPSGAATLHVERFTSSLTPGARYTMHVTNAGATGGSVLLDGATVVSAAELASGMASFVRPVALTGDDTVRVTMSGGAGATLAVRVLATADPLVSLFGPHTYVRPSGAAVPMSDGFAVPEGVGAPFYLVVQNGDAAGQYRSSSAELRLNGVEQLTTSDVNQQVAGFVRPVTLAVANQVDYIAHGMPGNRVTVEILGTDIAAPVLTIDAPAAESVTRDAELELRGTV